MKAKNNPKSKVPATEVRVPETKKLTKTQKDLFNTHMRSTQESIQRVINAVANIAREEFMKLGNLILEKDIKVFMEELDIDIDNEDWEFNQAGMQFTKIQKGGK